MASIDEINATVAAMFQAGSSFQEVRDFMEQSSVQSMDSASQEKIYSAYEEARSEMLIEKANSFFDGEKPEGEISSYDDDGNLVTEPIPVSTSAEEIPQDSTSAEEIPQEDPPVEPYEVVSGDTLGEIAADNDTTVDVLVELNPDITAENVGAIDVGQTIILPPDETQTIIDPDDINPATGLTHEELNAQIEEHNAGVEEAIAEREAAEAADIAAAADVVIDAAAAAAADPEWLVEAQQNYEKVATAADQTEAAYVALREEREALEAEIAAGGDTGTVAISADIEGDSLQAQLLAAKIAEEEAFQVASGARMDFIEEGDELADAEKLRAAQVAGEQAQAELDKAAGDAVTEVMTTDIMQGKDVSADSLEQLEAAAKQAYDTLTTAAQADDQGQYEKEQVENLEKLVEDTTEIYETATKAYEEVQEEVVKKAEEEAKETAALIDEFTGEDGLGRDKYDNITVGENIDTKEEAAAMAAAVDAQLADVNELLEGQTKEWKDVDDDGIQDPGETVDASNKELLGEEAISALEAQKESLEGLQDDLLEAAELIDATDALIAAGGDPQAKAMQSFWTNAPKYDPKAQFRFKVIIGDDLRPGMALQDALGGGQDVSPSGDPYNDIPDDTKGLVWYAKSVDKPTIQFAKFAEGFHRMALDASDVMPLVEQPIFSSISMTLIDPTYPNATRKLLRFLRRSGYMDNQARETNDVLDIDPIDAFMDSIGDVQIQQLDSDGKVLEIWWLQDAFPAEINFGKLDYSSTDFVEIGITWTYKSVKVQMEVKGAEEKFVYFKDYKPTPRPGAGNTSTCSDRWTKSGSNETLKLWQDGLVSTDKCSTSYKPPAD